ncbi:Ig-like domain-containing protein [Fulvivirga lutea]|uniref:DUF4625 domain-containing protein n=1 Tax=Fulvivirga lutea TaxID=2810512 RepID=A0A975A198_9BACT|nr:Ig-like domain-containing protein [Fulvivirga lutea]QSE97631.1 hypothetical protein JR347_00655 [Fulvivirga lutea]
MKKLLLFLLSAAVVFSCTEESIETSTPQFTDEEKTVTVVLANIPDGFEGEDVYIFTLNSMNELHYIQGAVATEDEEVLTSSTPGGASYSLIVYIPTVSDWTTEDSFSDGWYSSISSTLEKDGKFITDTWTNSSDFDESEETLDEALANAGTIEVLTVSFASLPSDGVYGQGDIFAVTATPNDNIDAGISSVEFLLNGTSLEVINEEPYSININTIDFPVGKHVLAVIATNGNGDTAEDDVEIEITGSENTAPDVSFTATYVGNGLSGSGTIGNLEEVERQELVTLNATVSDANLESVEFIIDGSTVYSATPDDAPYSFEWDTFENSVGTVIIEVKGTDTDGATRSAFLNLTLVDPDNFIPRGTLNSPSNGANFDFASYSITFSVTVTDAEGDAIESVRLSDIDSPFGPFPEWITLASEPYEVTFDEVSGAGFFAPGDWETNAHVYDNLGRYTKTNSRRYTFN